MKKKDMTGQLIGKWTVICEDTSPRTDTKARWICECECGTRRSVDGYSLRSGGTRGCGSCYLHLPTNSYHRNGNGTVTVRCKHGHTFIVDNCDMPLVRKYQWHVNNQGYVVSGSRKPMLRLHRYLMGLDDKDSNVFVDHITGVMTDNRRANLRICRPDENNRNQKVSTKNTSGFKGVSYWRSKRKWFAEIVYRDENRVRHRKFLGGYHSPEEAAAAYDKAAVLYHGEFARTNKMLGLLEDRHENSKTI